MLLTMLYVMTQGSTGSVTLFTSTENFEASLLLGKRIGVFVVRAIATISNDPLGGLPGRETTLSLFAVTVKTPSATYRGYFYLICFFLF